MINAIVKPDAIELPAGAVVRVLGTWQDYQTLLEHLGDSTSPRVKYRNGELLLMVPLPELVLQLDIIVDMVAEITHQFKKVKKLTVQAISLGAFCLLSSAFLH